MRTFGRSFDFGAFSAFAQDDIRGVTGLGAIGGVIGLGTIGGVTFGAFRLRVGTFGRGRGFAGFGVLSTVAFGVRRLRTFGRSFDFGAFSAFAQDDIGGVTGLGAIGGVTGLGAIGGVSRLGAIGGVSRLGAIGGFAFGAISWFAFGALCELSAFGAFCGLRGLSALGGIGIISTFCGALIGPRQRGHIRDVIAGGRIVHLQRFVLGSGLGDAHRAESRQRAHGHHHDH